MAYALLQELELTTEQCCSCSIMFALPTSLERRLRSDGRAFYCPNGHAMSYTESEADRLRKKLDEQTRIATRQAARAKEAEECLAKATAKANKVTKTLGNLKRRIKTKERTWKPPEVA